MDFTRPRWWAGRTLPTSGHPSPAPVTATPQNAGNRSNGGTMKYYISGPITLGGTELHTLEQRKEEFDSARRAFLAEHPEVSPDDIINPLEVLPECDYMCDPGQLSDAPPFIHTHSCYMKYDIIAMMRCDAIIMLPGWLDSKGARIEYHLAQDLGYQIIYMDSAGCFSDA